MLLTQTDPTLDLFLRGRRTEPALNSPAMDAYRRDDDVWVHIDAPGVASDSIDVEVERSVLTVTARRNWQRDDSDHIYVNERPRGTFRRQVHLGDSLDTDNIEADFADGVLTLRIPVSARAKPVKIPIGSSPPKTMIDAESTTA